MAEPTAVVIVDTDYVDLDDPRVDMRRMLADEAAKRLFGVRRVMFVRKKDLAAVR